MSDLLEAHRRHAQCKQVCELIASVFTSTTKLAIVDYNRGIMAIMAIMEYSGSSFHKKIAKVKNILTGREKVFNVMLTLSSNNDQTQSSSMKGHYSLLGSLDAVTNRIENKFIHQTEN